LISLRKQLDAWALIAVNTRTAAQHKTSAQLLLPPLEFMGVIKI